MARIVLLSHNVIDRMVSDVSFHEFAVAANPPRLKKAIVVARTGGCGGCRRNKRKAVAKSQKAIGAVDYNAFKQQVIALPPDQLAALKDKLQCTGIKVQVSDQRKTIQRSVI